MSKNGKIDMDKETTQIFVELLKKQFPLLWFLPREKDPNKYSILVLTKVGDRTRFELISEFSVEMFAKYPPLTIG